MMQTTADALCARHRLRNALPVRSPPTNQNPPARPRRAAVHLL